ncbi:MAG: CoA-binding protein [Alphaproteobacteria bacterium]|nr:CoA-binding protein [Alphaproteobacteria bacterium]
MSTLDRLFDPRSIAVIGASAAPEKAGYQFLASIAGFPGRVLPINPRGGTIHGFEAFPTLAAAPGPIDLVVLAVPPQFSPAILREAATSGAGAALMISGGFAETGAAGAALQAEVLDACRAGGIRLLGPNTSGFVRPSRGLFATFVPGIQDVRAGSIGIVAQSGGINLAAALAAHAAGLGVSLAVGLGNAPDVDLAAAIDYLAVDPETRAIALHLEGVPDGRLLYAAVARAAAAKPVAALPVGRADIARFARSHTGNLMGSHAATAASLMQAGAVVVETLDELLDAAHALSMRRLAAKPRIGVGVVTGQAGPGLLIADALLGAGETIPPLADGTARAIAERLPPLTYIGNPVDTGRPAESFGAIVEAVAHDPAIDVVLAYAILEPDAMDPVAQFGAHATRWPSAVVYGTAGIAAAVDPVIAAMRRSGIACFDTPDRAARAVAALCRDARAAARRAVEPDRAMPAPAAPIAGPIDEAAAKAVIAAAGIAVPPHRIARDHAEANAALAAFGGPVAVKVLDASIHHKTEVGGVHLDIATPADLAAALTRIDAIGDGRHRYLIEPMAPPGIELIVGARNDPAHGPIVMVGLGGIFAETLRDTAVALAPLGPATTAETIGRLRAQAVLDGFRGLAPVDRTSLAQVLVRLGDLIAAHPEIAEIEINPLRAGTDGLVALDALVLPATG